ncbi:uncharacterized protein [Antennarius striatus]|uniref:uncharacterized protein n=1 Tax=Antennarius striatus TaxID=241820 RepID=UPI0035B0F778
MEKRSDNVEKSVSKIGQANQQLRRSYDRNFKMMVINEAESSNNCKAAVKYGVPECNVRRWRAQKDRLKNAHSQRKTFRGPQSGRFQELDRRVFAYVDEKRKDGMPISRAVIQLMALEIAEELNIPTADFKASLNWCNGMMRRNGLRLRHRTSQAQRLPSDFGEKLLSFQRYVVNLRKKHSYPLEQIGNADQTPVFFDVPTPVTVHEKDGPQHHVCKEEEVEVPADQQLWYQEVKSSVDQEEPEVLHLKEEPEVLHLKEEPEVLHLKEEPEVLHLKGEPQVLHSSQKGEQLALKQETDPVTLTPTLEENDHSEDQTLYMKAEDGAAQTESVANMPVISSVVGAANIDLLISNSSHVSISHEERGETSRKDVDIESQLRSQRTSNTSKKSDVYKICKRGYTTCNNLKDHVKNHRDEKPYRCEICGKGFINNGGLIIHERNHTGERPYRCETCAKGFSEYSALKKHETIHAGERPYRCETCGKEFRSSDALVKHKRIHTVEKAYKCETCGKEFRASSTLIKHQGIHTGEKRYRCETCGKYFLYKISLTNHMVLHTGESSYRCETWETF